MCTEYASSYYSDDPAFHIIQVYVRNNIANIGNLTKGMLASDCPLVSLESSTFTIIIDKTTSPTLILLHSLYRPGQPLVLLSVQVKSLLKTKISCKS